MRYQGQVEATQADEGWTIGESESTWGKMHGDEPAQRFNAAGTMPQQVQLNITSAPAEFCLPMKNDRQFKPHFQVQVRHDGCGRCLESAARFSTDKFRCCAPSFCACTLNTCNIGTDSQE